LDVSAFEYYTMPHHGFKPLFAYPGAGFGRLVLIRVRTMNLKKQMRVAALRSRGLCSPQSYSDFASSTVLTVSRTTSR
jgi:hypothetical protein